VINDDHDAIELFDGAFGADLRNNIVQIGGSAATILMDSASTPSTVIDSNCYHHRTGTATGPGDNSIVADPIFIDSSNGDLHLFQNSPCIDAGDDSGIGFDFDGTPRPQGQGYDIGAYELITADLIFADGFESGDLSAWSSSQFY